MSDRLGRAGPVPALAVSATPAGNEGSSMTVRRLVQFVPARTEVDYGPHRAALLYPTEGYEVGVRDMAQGIETYAMFLYEKCQDGIDGVASAAVGQMLTGFTGLLTCDIGRFNGRCLHEWAGYLAALVGYCLDHDEMAYDCGCGVDKVRADHDIR